MARASTTPNCGRGDCRLRGMHIRDCVNVVDDKACDGCLPASAAHGLRLCEKHAVHLGLDAMAAGRLYLDLELQLQPRRRGISERVTGSRDLSPMPHEAVMDARDRILAVLRSLSRTAASERGIPIAGLAKCERPTANERSDHAQARVAELGVGQHSDIATSPPQRVAAEAEVLAAFVAKQARWLAAHPQAGIFSKALFDATRPTLRIAYPSNLSSVAIGICPCGGRVVWHEEAWDVARCEACGMVANIVWWEREINADSDAIVDTVTGARWLSHVHGRPVRPSVIANWASRGHVPRLLDANGQPVRDARRRQLYKRSDLEACAAMRYHR